MKPVEQLINTTDDGWPTVKKWIDEARNKIEVLPADPLSARDALYKTQVTTRSPMGAIIYHTGGILVDGGWIRILGSGSKKLNRTLPDWNKGRSFNDFGDTPAFLLIADDIAGGFFAINGGAFGDNLGKVFYLAPDTLSWEPTDLSYSDFLLFCFHGDLNEFYADRHWENWRADAAKCDGNKAFSFYPFLWTKEGKDINKTSRSIVPVEEVYFSEMDMRRQLKKK